MLHSVILYAAPVWSGKVEKYRTYRTALLQVQRNMALRVICAYRTVSYDASLLLARVPPIYLLAARQRRIYERLHSRLTVEDHEGETLIANAESREEIWEAANTLMLRQWRIYLDNVMPQGKRTKDAIMPVFDQWVNREFGNLNYHMTQILTGHGSYQQHLCRIGKAETEGCAHCESISDSVEYTIGECPAWESQRETLKAEVGNAATKGPRSLVSCMLRDRTAWRAVSTFAIQVITAKEAAEHEAERGRGGETLQQRRRRSASSSSSSSCDTGDAVVPDGNGDHG